MVRQRREEESRKQQNSEANIQSDDSSKEHKSTAYTSGVPRIVKDDLIGLYLSRQGETTLTEGIEKQYIIFSGGNSCLWIPLMNW